MLDLGPLAGPAGLRMPSTVVGQSARYSAERTRLQDAKYCTVRSRQPGLSNSHGLLMPPVNTAQLPVNHLWRQPDLGGLLRHTGGDENASDSRGLWCPAIPRGIWPCPWCLDISRA
jgi:hypothetical protein